MIEILQVWDHEQDIPVLPEGEWVTFDWRSAGDGILDRVDELLESYGLEITIMTGHSGTLTQLSITKRESK